MKYVDPDGRDMALLGDGFVVIGGQDGNKKAGFTGWSILGAFIGAMSGMSSGGGTSGPTAALATEAGSAAGAVVGAVIVNIAQKAKSLLSDLFKFASGDIGQENSGNTDESINRVSNPKHHANSQSPEPKNVDDLFDKSISDKSGVRWSKDSDGTIHRFSKPSNGESHWNGSTAGDKPIRIQDIPIEIRRAFE